MVTYIKSPNKNGGPQVPELIGQAADSLGQSFAGMLNDDADLCLIPKGSYVPIWGYLPKAQ